MLRGMTRKETTKEADFYQMNFFLLVQNWHLNATELGVEHRVSDLDSIKAHTPAT